MQFVLSGCSYLSACKVGYPPTLLYALTHYMGPTKVIMYAYLKYTAMDNCKYTTLIAPSV